MVNMQNNASPTVPLGWALLTTRVRNQLNMDVSVGFSPLVSAY